MFNCSKVRGKRCELNITQEEMARKMNLSATSYSKKEKGKTDFTVSELEKIVEITNTPVSYFFEK